MLHTVEEPTRLDLELGEDDIAREYEELSDMEDLGPLPPEADEGALLETAGELALVRDELEELADLEDREESYAATHGAELESTEDRVTRNYEGIELDDLGALARFADEAESSELPEDDAIERAGEWIAG